MQVRIGDNLSIFTASGLSFSSKIDSVFDEHQFLINTPIVREKNIILPKGKEYTFLFYTQDGLYQSKGMVLEYCFQNKVTLMKIRVGEFKKVQRRQFFRLNIIMDFTYSRLKDLEKISADDNIPVYKGIIKNISAGGLCFATHELLKTHEHILCSLSLEKLLLTAEVEVLYIQRSENRDDTYICRSQLINLNKWQQEKIIKFVFDKELEMYNKKIMESEENEQG